VRADYEEYLRASIDVAAMPWGDWGIAETAITQYCAISSQRRPAFHSAAIIARQVARPCAGVALQLAARPLVS
jgi:hypothetical protein